MNRVTRLSVVAVGLAVAVYGVASLTGGWLGMPPWLERVRHAQLVDLDELERSGAIRLTYEFPPSREHPSWTEPRPDREWISGGVATAGVGLTILGAWKRHGRAFDLALTIET